VTHNAEAAQHCGRIVSLHDGQIVRDEPNMAAETQ
jgi:ABC-type lipoprotein export system ATPase subunit